MINTNGMECIIGWFSFEFYVVWMTENLIGLMFGLFRVFLHGLPGGGWMVGYVSP